MHNIISPLSFFCITIVLFYSCSTTTHQKIPSPKAGFIKNEYITDEAQFSSIKSNVARLHSMLTGEYVQHIKIDTQKVYNVWTVNDGKDSVILCNIPIGDPRKNGYWVYHGQYMTSLTNEPLSSALEKLVVIDRDTILGYMYNAPTDFAPSLATLKEKHRNAFGNLNIKQIEQEEHTQIITYVRQSPLLFRGNGQISVLAQKPEWSKSEHYTISPEGIIMIIHVYDPQENMKKINTYDSKFVKLSLVK